MLTWRGKGDVLSRVRQDLEFAVVMLSECEACLADRPLGIRFLSFEFNFPPHTCRLLRNIRSFASPLASSASIVT